MDQTQISVISPFLHYRCDSEKKWEMKNEKEFFLYLYSLLRFGFCR